MLLAYIWGHTQALNPYQNNILLIRNQLTKSDQCILQMFIIHLTRVSIFVIKDLSNWGPFTRLELR